MTQFFKKSVAQLRMDHIIEKEPLAQFGFGVVSYLQVMQFMSFVFLGLSVLQIPILYIYKSGSAYKTSSNLFTGGWDFYMLGNLGYSSVNCDSLPVTVGHLGFQCNVGHVGEIFDFGFHERNDEDTIEMCINDEMMSACKPDHPAFLKQLKEAIGKQQFSIDFSQTPMFADTFFSRPDQCNNDQSNSIFVQYSCVQTED